MSPLIPHKSQDVVDFRNMVGSGLVPACGAKEENITLNQAVFVSQDMSFNYSDLSSETIGIMTDWSND